MIVRFLETYFNNFNVTDLVGCDGEYEGNKCGECWKFVYAPNEITGLKNLYEPNEYDVCCTHVFLKSWSDTDNIRIDDFNGTSIITGKTYNLQLDISKYSKYEDQKGTENGCDLDNSIYGKVIEPLEDCLCDFDMNICNEFVSCQDRPSHVYISSMTKTPFYSENDFNWAGLRLNFTLVVGWE